LDYIVPGLVSGSVLLLATVGFSLTRRVEGFLNIAHAQLLVVGGFGAYFFNVSLGWSLILSGILGVVLTVLVGIVSARLVYWPLRGQPHVISLIASIGLAFLIGGMVEAFSGHGARTLDVPLYRTIEIAGVGIAAADQLITIGLAATAVLGLHLWLSRSHSGRSIRAMASDRNLAEVRGVNTSNLLYVVWAVASGLAGLAGVMIALSSRVYSEMGWDQILLISAAAIVGGLSNIYGVMGASILVGLAASLTTLVLPLQYGQVVVFGLIVLVVFLRPSGLAADDQVRVA
jgi:branched-subunit amino acid ABC-type transport system permease component